MSAFLESTSEVVSLLLCSGPVLPAFNTPHTPHLPNQLGEYMLKGWTLTDLVCSNCHTTPLMREPVGQARDAGRGESQRIEFCGRCQGGPGRAGECLSNFAQRGVVFGTEGTE